MRRVVALQLRLRMDSRYAAASDRPAALARDAGIAKSQVFRVLGEEVGVSVDILERLAFALGCRPYELLVPPPALLSTLTGSSSAVSTEKSVLVEPRARRRRDRES